MLKIQRAEQPGTILFSLGALAVVSAIAALIFWWIFQRHASLWSAAAIGGALFLGGVLYLAREAVLVALRDANTVFIEQRNVLTGIKTRRAIGCLSELTGYEVKPHVDMDTAISPFRYYELRLLIRQATPVWYCGSRELAEEVGEALLRLRPSGQ